MCDDPARAIVDASRVGKADIIAMATRGHGGLRRAITGGFTDRVVRASSVPVLVLNPHARVRIADAQPSP